MRMKTAGQYFCFTHKEASLRKQHHTRVFQKTLYMGTKHTRNIAATPQTNHLITNYFTLQRSRTIFARSLVTMDNATEESAEKV